MKTDTACQPDPAKSGLDLAEALALNEGWQAAARGEPFTMSHGLMWVSGFIQYHWWKDGPTRSWKRH